jgi:Tol biopolymer transport system component
MDWNKRLHQAVPGCPIEGTNLSRPCVPSGVKQRRITHTANGIQGPRFWLRTTPDGKNIGFLSADQQGIIQVFVVSPNGGSIKQVTFNSYSVEGPINFSPDGSQVAYIAGKRVCSTFLATGKTIELTPEASPDQLPVGAAVWSYNGRHIAFNRNVRDESGKFNLQIFLLNL